MAHYKPNDYYARKARQDNYAARSAYKLEEIQQRYNILRRGDRVLDLGCAPGSWSQYAAQMVGSKGAVLGIDLQEVMIGVPNTTFIQGDILEMDWQATLAEHGFAQGLDVVISDMAPQTTGMRLTDQSRSYNLCAMALDIACQVLRPGGHFVCKFFDGPDFNALRDEIRHAFPKLAILRPKSTRASSKEIFFIGQGYNGVGSPYVAAENLAAERPSKWDPSHDDQVA